MLAITYGLNNFEGFCNDPGAIAIWNIFSNSSNLRDRYVYYSSTFSLIFFFSLLFSHFLLLSLLLSLLFSLLLFSSLSSLLFSFFFSIYLSSSLSLSNLSFIYFFSGNKISEPEIILDHSVSLISHAFHPLNPSLIVAGSYNGEIILWDLSSSTSNISSSSSSSLSDIQPLAISQITNYSHFEPIIDIKWIPSLKYTSSSSSISSSSSSIEQHLREWQILSISSDGKIFIWDYIDNKFKYPYKGYYLTNDNKKLKSSSSSSSSSTTNDDRKNLLLIRSTCTKFNLNNKFWYFGQNCGNISRITYHNLTGGELTSVCIIFSL